MKRQRRPWRRVTLGAALALIFLQILSFIMPPRIAPVGPLNLLARSVIATSTLAEQAGTSARQGFERYLANSQGMARAHDLELENERLRMQRDWARDFIDSRTVIDEMIGWPFRPWHGYAGRVVYHDPVERHDTAWVAFPEGASVRGHAVATARGLVGRVINQVGRQAQVLLVNDVDSAVDTVSSAGVRAIVRGTGGRLGRVDFVPTYERLNVGDILTTSGRDRTYPAGISVAVVEEINRGSEHLYLTASVQFLVNVAAVEWVHALPPAVPQQ